MQIKFYTELLVILQVRDSTHRCMFTKKEKDLTRHIYPLCPLTLEILVPIISV